MYLYLSFKVKFVTRAILRLYIAPVPKTRETVAARQCQWCVSSSPNASLPKYPYPQTDAKLRRLTDHSFIATVDETYALFVVKTWNTLPFLC